MFLLPLLVSLAFLSTESQRGIVSIGDHFNTCTYAACLRWCRAIPCCTGGEWRAGNCSLSNALRQPSVLPSCLLNASNAPCSFSALPRTQEEGVGGPVHPLLRKWRMRNLTLCFHVNQISERGAERATFDYAYFAQRLLGHSVHFLTTEDAVAAAQSAEMLRVFVREFGEFHTYNADPEWMAVHGCPGCQGGPAMADLVHRLRCHMVYAIKAGSLQTPPIVPESTIRVPFTPHATFHFDAVHGTSYAAVGTRVAAEECPQGATVHHMVRREERLPGDTPEDLRRRFHVKDGEYLLCRHGGFGTFNIPWIRGKIRHILTEFPKVHLLLMNTKPIRRSHPRVHYLAPRVERKERLEYFEACDAMLHARLEGETFGLAVGEMSVHNRPVITSSMGAQEHVRILGKRGFVYSDYSSLLQQIRRLTSTPRSKLLAEDWNAYREYMPERIMKAFDEVFLQPALVYWARLEQVGITDPWNVSMNSLPPRYNYFYRCHAEDGRILPTADTLLRWLPHLCPPAVPPD